MQDGRRGQGFWRPGSEKPGVSLSQRVSLDVDQEVGGDGDGGGATAGLALSFPGLSSSAGGSFEQQRRRLPVFARRDAILYLVEHHATTVVVGQTGSGKTTQIPQYLVEAGWSEGGRLIGCTQPRRVAVQTVAARVAEEMGVSLGAQVGYAIRFENVTTPGVTRIKFLTDGVLLREMMEDPLLSKYSVLMVDEAHERSVATDILLGLLKKVQRRRPDLRLIISSATLAAQEIADFFASSKEPVKPMSGVLPLDLPSCKPAILSVEGRSFPVQQLYLEEPTSDYMQSALDTVLAIHTREGPGAILVFVTGHEEVESLVQLITEQASSYSKQAQRLRDLLALPLYAGLESSAVDCVFAPVPRGKRKVIVATNIAETSVTLEDVVYVVDTGFVKQRFYDPLTAVDSLLLVPISRASAIQRAGRAGRVRPGKCYRLYTEDCFDTVLPAASIPEIQRSDVTPTVLQLKALGIDNIMRFDWLSSPSPSSMIRALETLFAIGALDSDGRLTRPDGLRMAEMPLEPLIACMLLASARKPTFTAHSSLPSGASGGSRAADADGAGKGEEGSRGAGSQHGNRRVAGARGDGSDGDGDGDSGSGSGGEEDDVFGLCSEEMCTIAACLCVQSVWVSSSGRRREADEMKERFAASQGDLISYLNVFEGFDRSRHSSSWCHANGINYRAMLRVEDVRGQLRKLLKNLGLPIVSCDRDVEIIQRAIAASFFVNTARLLPDSDGTTYKAVRGNHLLKIHPSSVLFRISPQWLVFRTACRVDSQLYMRDVTPVEPHWLRAAAPHFFAQPHQQSRR